MADSNIELSASEIHYVFDNSEFILNEETLLDSEVENVVCSDGSKAILVEGQYLIADNQAVLLQGDTNLQQYYINDNSEEFIVQDDEGSSSNLFTQSQFIEVVKKKTDSSESHQILYYTNDNTNTKIFSMSEDICVGTQGIQDEDGNFYPFKRLKLEGEMVNFSELIESGDSASNDHQIVIDENAIDYVLEVDPTSDEFISTIQQEKIDSKVEIVDLSKITGRNLITGQTVTLHSYMEKLKRKLKLENNFSNLNFTRKREQNLNNEIINNDKTSELSNLLDKKISIGKTKSGKKIIGKIIHVEKKPNNQKHITDNDKNVVPEVPVIYNPLVGFEDREGTDTPKVLNKRVAISNESFEEISKTLGGVMEMDSIRENLENKNIIVKLVEKRYSSENDNFVKNTSYSYGYMAKEIIQNESEEMTETWRFVSDQNKQNTLLGDIYHDMSIRSEHELNDGMTANFLTTTSLTILISYGKTIQRTIRMNLNPAPGNLCTICAQYFKSSVQLRFHMHNVHNAQGNINMCEICNKSFDNIKEHKEIHIKEGKLFVCTDCNKNFPSQAKLNKHLPNHNIHLRPLQCSVCQARCANEWALKKHLITHTGFKPFACNICQKHFFTQYEANFHRRTHFPEKSFECSICFRTFHRHSNLLRHQEIHKGSGVLYKCNVCGCSYNYASSLTRHMVQNHIDSSDSREKTSSID